MNTWHNLHSRASWLRPRYLLFGLVVLMLAYVIPHDESFLVHPKDPIWQHYEPFKWWLLPHGIAGGCGESKPRKSLQRQRCWSEKQAQEDRGSTRDCVEDRHELVDHASNAGAAGSGYRNADERTARTSGGDINFANKKITLNQTWVYGRIENGKTEESREPVLLGERTAEFLQEWHRQTPYAGKGDWVFASNKLRGKRPISGPSL
jgi:hypothetical protein